MEGNRNYADECGDHGGTNNRGEPCGRAAGWGTESDTGRCRRHLGTSPDGSSHEGNDHAEGHGAPEENQNAVTHGLHAKQVNSFYQQVLGEELQALVDDIFADYIEKYERLHGEPTTGDAAELFRIAVSYGKHVHADNWALERPDALDSGSPVVDRETHISESGERYYRYKETVVAKGQARLSRDRRSWLKDLGLMDDPQSQTATAVGDLASIIADES